MGYPYGRRVRVSELLWVTYLVIVVWVLLGKPDVRVRIMALTRKALRRIATASSSAAQSVEDAMLDAATRHNA